MSYSRLGLFLSLVAVAAASETSFAQTIQPIAAPGGGLVPQTSAELAAAPPALDLREGPAPVPVPTFAPGSEGEQMLFPPAEQTPGRQVFAQPVPNGYDRLSDRRIEDVYDQAGVIGGEASPPIRRRPYPYGNDQEYWYGHDANVEAWGNQLLELPYVRLGWFASLDTTVFQAQVKPHFSGVVDNGPPVTLAAAGLNWNVSPKLDLGYRFEHGLGEIMFSYRYLNADGSDPFTAFGADGRIATKVNLQTLDLNWCVQEFHPEGMPFIFPLLKSWGRAGLGKALTPNWFEPPLEMRWIFGVRGVTMYYNTTAQGALSRESVMTNLNGVGINFGVDLNQRIRVNRPWYIHARALASGIFGYTDQNFERTTGGVTTTGIIRRDGLGVPAVVFDIGMSYRPSFPHRNVEFVMAWQREQWFSFASTSTSNADIIMQGVMFRTEYKY